ncbi:AAA family ATPase [Herbiconiux sp. CPCC 205716]|uniref:AAA family ATPase n=1 Tax=Herbiconiux gentiana TaxID=2970912 RepID=A0ABT2GEA9_9MICO|nr:BTAD domain-containing putative transcriptional regulator [Herbiconiux gentiana]MCS5714522.1 AAA family ATPase [Herbiconiux gentiana]
MSGGGGESGAEPAGAPSGDGRVRAVVGVLGPVAVGRDGAWGEPAGRRAKAVLVVLALAAPRAVGAEALIDEVWGEDPPRAARGALQALVSRLRSGFGDGVIESTASGYRLGVGVDLASASALAGHAAEALSRGAHEDAARLAAEAIRLWRGAPGADLEPGELADDLAARAGELSLSLETTAATAALALGHPADAETAARRLAARAPFDDHAQLLLMRALDGQGRSTEAVAAFAEFRERVQDALGASPSPELQALNLELLERAERAPTAPSSATEGSRDAAAPDDGAAPVARGIRAAPNALVGREEAVATVRALLQAARVTTVLGPGGLGKTRLAHEVAARSVGEFGAVVVVELASVRSAEDVVFALASALGIRELGSSRRMGDQRVRADLRTRILDRLGERRTLLVVDNCEHLIDAAAEWAAELTAELPALTLLTTSRTPLRISSERVYALQPLGVGDGQTTDDPAVRLFLDRATAARPGAVLDPVVVARLCERLDGLPLAIELAAARIRTMSLDEIERRLGNRFSLLTGGDRSAPERHRTLLAVIEWSWNLLGREEQRALARLSEFADGFSAEAARAVVGAGVDEALDGLVAQSLVTVTEVGGSGAAGAGAGGSGAAGAGAGGSGVVGVGAGGAGLRFRMLETVREFGRLQLEREGLRDDVEAALFDWSSAFGERTLPRLSGREQLPALAAVAAEEDNLVDVLRRAVDAGRADVVASVFALLAWYWSLRGAHSEVLAFSGPVFEAIRRYEPTAERTGSTVLSLVLVAITQLVGQQRAGVRALSRLREVLAAHPVTEPRLAAMAELALAVGDLGRLDAAVVRARSSADRPTALLAGLVASLTAENAGRSAEAVAAARRAVTLAEALGDTWGAGMAAQTLAQLHSQNAEPAEALRWALEARVSMAAVGASDDVRQLEWVIAANDIGVGALDEAAEIFERLTADPGQSDGVDVAAIGRAGLAEVLRARGLVEESAEAYRLALAALDVPRGRSSPWFRMMLSSVLASLVVDGTGTADERRRLARRLRARTLAGLRPDGAFVDRPVFGASLVGLAAWAAGVPAIGAGVALELLALAETMGPRQDNPSLHVAPLFARFVEEVSEDAVAAARASAALIDHDERPGRAAELLRTPGPWSWAWTD